jgi:multiple sugar transport system ATP-binding protein
MEALRRDGANTVTVGFRPESVELVGEADGFPMEVDVVEELGSDAYAYGRLGQNSGELRPTDERTIVRVDPRKPPLAGHTAYLRVLPEELHVFSPTTGNRVEA